MRRDSIFYRLFAQNPQLLFQLINDPPPNADRYSFNAVGVKEPKFEIDGVFLPPESQGPGIVYFGEIQFQPDPLLYERLFSESLLYFYQQRHRFSDWRAVIIYPNRATEQTDTLPYEDFLNSRRVTRIYLDELGDPEQLPIEVAMMVLTILKENTITDQARALIQRTRTEIPEPKRQGIINTMTSIMVYKFTNLTRQEVETMLGINNVNLKDTRFYQDIKAETFAEFQEEFREEFREALQQGEQVAEARGQLKAKRDLLHLLITQKFSPPAKRITQAIALLTSPQLDQLAIALLPFNQPSDLETWLKTALREILQTQIATQFPDQSLTEIETLLSTQTLKELIVLHNSLPTLLTLEDLIESL